MPAPMDQAFIRKMQEKVEEERRKKEKEILTYWRGELDLVLKRRNQDLASLSSNLKQVIAKMDRRLSVL